MSPGWAPHQQQLLQMPYEEKRQAYDQGTYTPGWVPQELDDSRWVPHEQQPLRRPHETRDEGQNAEVFTLQGGYIKDLMTLGWVPDEQQPLRMPDGERR